MKRAASIGRRFLGDNSGPTASEYALILALVAAAVVGASSLIGPRVSGIFSSLPIPAVAAQDPSPPRLPPAHAKTYGRIANR